MLCELLHTNILSLNRISVKLIFVLVTTLFSVTNAQSIRINEFMALNNSTLADEEGDFSDWIELYNSTNEAVNLSGWILTDDLENNSKWIFPDTSINAQNYLLIFASGKDKQIPGKVLHTNFSLDKDGEYLAFINSDGTIITEFDPSFSSMSGDKSIIYYQGNYLVTNTPTPGMFNLLSFDETLNAPTFTYKHGFYEEPFDVEITSNYPTAKIYYTTDGSEPGAAKGSLYASQLSINRTTVLRAIVVINDSLLSSIATTTYLFLDDVIKQPNNPPGYPAAWGPYFEMVGTAIADYEMDPEITRDPNYSNLMKESLLSLPTISIVSNKNNFFSHSTDPDSGGIYIYTGPPENGDVPGLGDGWERPVSVEYFSEYDTKDFQINCGIRIHGGHSRRVEKTPKHSFRLIFRNEYGASKLNYNLFGERAVNSINTIVLRAGYGNSFLHYNHSERRRTQLIRDIWAKNTIRDMGNISSNGNYAHLYINGIYWGIYNPTERIDKVFTADYLGGNEDDYDVIKDYGAIVEGNANAWNEMMSLANGGLSSSESYHKIQGNNPDGTPNPDYPNYLDLENFIDYMILNFYGSNWDWDGHNWVAVRNRVNPGKGFKFFSWDAEHVVELINDNILGKNNAGRPSRLFQKLRENEKFRQLFANRIQKHFYNNGALSVTAATDRWMELANQIETAIIAESARWGDYRRDVHPWRAGQTFDLYDKDYWLNELNYITQQYFPQRGDVFIQHLKQSGLYPQTDAPLFFINNNPVLSNTIKQGDMLSMSVTSGSIYYTINGGDPLSVDSPDDSGNEFVLFSESQRKRALVPDSEIDRDWLRNIEFDDADWRLCIDLPGGIGYENSSGYENFIGLDIGSEMQNNTSCYVRIKFDTGEIDVTSLRNMTLDVIYDDGFIAYLNGTKIAEANAPVNPVWNSSASSGIETSDFESFNISQHLGLLRSGENLLAIHAMNSSLGSSDFLINARLIADDKFTESKVSEDALLYGGPIELGSTSIVNARSFSGNEWSALSTMNFNLPSDIHYIKLTEIHYNPLAQDSTEGSLFEFIELKNTGEVPVDLSYCEFIDGIFFTFPGNTIVYPGSFIVLASNENFFYTRYNFKPFGSYSGNLNNTGERIVFVSADEDTVFSIRYNDRAPWSEAADGAGYSLVPTRLNPSGDQNNPDHWQVSLNINGSPGYDDEAPTGAEDDGNRLPGIFYLYQNYPNPFNPSTNIIYSIPHSGLVTLKVYNLLGQEIETLVNQIKPAGRYETVFNASGLSSGVYFATIKFENYSSTNKILLVK
jgi:hypothetical protein